jgi:hypothetical protein
MPAALTSLFDTPLLEPVLLLSATRRAEGTPEAARALMKPYAAAARSRYRVALELRCRDSQGVALGLLREAAFLALCALEIAGDDPVSPSSRAAWERFSALPEPSGAPSNLAKVQALFASDDALAAELISPNEASAVRTAAEQTVAWLIALAEVRSPRELARARVVRASAFLVGAVAVVWALLSYWLALAALSEH